VLREVVAVFAATVSVTLPLPVPLLPFGKLTQDAVFEAVQAQPAPAVTLTVVDSPVAAEVLLAGLMA
jgi:hypothetical protein